VVTVSTDTVEIVIEVDALPAVEALRRAWWTVFLVQQRQLARRHLHRRVAEAHRRLGWEAP
jgi:hypothetical protein